jgi:hypothetical protein
MNTNEGGLSAAVIALRVARARVLMPTNYTLQRRVRKSNSRRAAAARRGPPAAALRPLGRAGRRPAAARAVADSQLPERTRVAAAAPPPGPGRTEPRSASIRLLAAARVLPVHHLRGGRGRCGWTRVGARSHAAALSKRPEISERACGADDVSIVVYTDYSACRSCRRSPQPTIDLSDRP